MPSKSLTFKFSGRRDAFGGSNTGLPGGRVSGSGGAQDLADRGLAAVALVDHSFPRFNCNLLYNEAVERGHASLSKQGRDWQPVIPAAADVGPGAVINCRLDSC